jgi:hypothetical protein
MHKKPYWCSYFTQPAQISIHVIIYALSHDFVIINNYVYGTHCLGTNTGVSKFRVHMKESEHLPVSGPVDLIVSEDGITLLSIQTGNGEIDKITAISAWCIKFSEVNFLRAPSPLKK